MIEWVVRIAAYNDWVSFSFTFLPYFGNGFRNMCATRPTTNVTLISIIRVPPLTGIIESPDISIKKVLSKI